MDDWDLLYGVLSECLSLQRVHIDFGAHHIGMYPANCYDIPSRLVASLPACVEVLTLDLLLAVTLPDAHTAVDQVKWADIAQSCKRLRKIGAVHICVEVKHLEWAYSELAGTAFDDRLKELFGWLTHCWGEHRSTLDKTHCSYVSKGSGRYFVVGESKDNMAMCNVEFHGPSPSQYANVVQVQFV